MVEVDQLGPHSIFSLESITTCLELAGLSIDDR